MPPTLRILLVDDSVVFRDRMRRHLESEPDLQVVGEAADGVEGLAETQLRQPDAVLLDLHMPGTDEFGTLRELRARHADLAIIVLTADASAAASQRCRELGSNGFIDKRDASTDVVPLLRELALNLLSHSSHERTR